MYKNIYTSTVRDNIGNCSYVWIKCGCSYSRIQYSSEKKNHASAWMTHKQSEKAGRGKRIPIRLRMTRGGRYGVCKLEIGTGSCQGTHNVLFLCCGCLV